MDARDQRGEQGAPGGVLLFDLFRLRPVAAQAVCQGNEAFPKISGIGDQLAFHQGALDGFVVAGNDVVNLGAQGGFNRALIEAHIGTVAVDHEVDFGTIELSAFEILEHPLRGAQGGQFVGGDQEDLV